MNPTKADMTARLAEALRQALAYVPLNASNDFIRNALDEFNAMPSDAATPEAKPSLHVFLGEDREPGDVPKTFTFDTEGEKAAFVQGLAAMCGNNDYDIVESADLSIDIEGQIRRFPADADPSRPIIDYGMRTADGCERTIIYGLTTDGEVIELETGPWTPQEPEAETVLVEISIRFDDGSMSADLNGDQHRDLEMSGSLSEYLVALADDNSARADTILEEASQSMEARP